MKKQFTLTHVAPLADGRLRLDYADGQTFQVDIKPIAARSPVLAALAQAKIVQRARLGAWGGSVCFGSEGDKNPLELAADNLRARAVEQSGQVSHEFLWEWLHRHGLTQQAGADALGISRRMLAYYLSGAKPVPRTVALACLGWQAQRAQDKTACSLMPPPLTPPLMPPLTPPPAPARLATA